MDIEKAQAKLDEEYLECVKVVKGNPGIDKAGATVCFAAFVLLTNNLERASQRVAPSCKPTTWWNPTTW